MAESKDLEAKTEMQVGEQPEGQDENASVQHSSDSPTETKTTESHQDKNQKEDVPKMGEDTMSFDYSSIGARPKDRSFCTRPQIPPKPKSLKKFERQNRCLGGLFKQIIIEEKDTMEENFCSDEEDIAKLVVPQTEDTCTILCEKYKQLYREVRLYTISVFAYLFYEYKI